MMNYEPPPDAFSLLLVGGVGDLAGGPPRRSEGKFQMRRSEEFVGGSQTVFLG